MKTENDPNHDYVCGARKWAAIFVTIENAAYLVMTNNASVRFGGKTNFLLKNSRKARMHTSS